MLGALAMLRASSRESEGGEEEEEEVRAAADAAAARAAAVLKRGCSPCLLPAPALPSKLLTPELPTAAPSLSLTLEMPVALLLGRVRGGPFSRGATPPAAQLPLPLPLPLPPPPPPAEPRGFLTRGSCSLWLLLLLLLLLWAVL